METEQQKIIEEIILDCDKDYSALHRYILDNNLLPPRLYRYRDLDFYDVKNETFDKEKMGYRKGEIYGGIYLSEIKNLNDIFDSSVYFPIGCEKDRRLLQEEIRESVWNKYRIASFSEDFDNILMWSHYTRFHEGICIEYDTSKKPEVWAEFLFPIIYSDKRVDSLKILNDIENKSYNTVLTPLLYKADVWKYEHEWRLVMDKELIEQNNYLCNVRGSVKRVFTGVKCINKEILQNLYDWCENEEVDIKPMKIGLGDEYRLEPQAPIIISAVDNKKMR